MREVWSLTRHTFSDWYEDRAQRMGAALAYYTIFALTPGLVLVMALAGLLLGPGAEQQIIEQFRELIGEQGAKAIEATVRSARAAPPGAAELALALVTLVIGLWGVFGELQDGLNTIWGVTPKPGRRIRDMVKERFWSFAMVVGTGFLLLVSLVVTAWLAAMSTYVSYLLPAPAVALEALNSVISLAVITGAFALIFKLLPDVRIAWRDVWLGAAVTSLLFTVGKFLIGLYLGKSAVASAYGAAGSLVIIVVWVYYSAQILLLGAEFTKVWTKRRGSGFKVERTAKAVTAEARAEQGLGPKRREKPSGHAAVALGVTTLLTVATVELSAAGDLGDEAFGLRLGLALDRASTFTDVVGLSASTSYPYLTRLTPLADLDESSAHVDELG